MGFMKSPKVKFNCSVYFFQNDTKMINIIDYADLKKSGHVTLIHENGAFFFEIKQAHPITGMALPPVKERINPPEIQFQTIAECEATIKRNEDMIAATKLLIDDQNQCLKKSLEEKLKTMDKKSDKK